MTKILYEKNVPKRIGLLTALLNGIMVKGPTVSEISGLLNASLKMDDILNNSKIKIHLQHDEPLLGVASSGKKGMKTINITTIACFVAAACGANIAKACSHSTSSKSDSADFLSVCGMDVGISLHRKIDILNRHHIGFFSIEDTTPKFADVYGGIFYAPHAMSFALAGLSFPVEIDALAYGVSHPNVKLSAEVLNKYHIKEALSYSTSLDGVHYIDEVLPAGTLKICRIRDGIVEDAISSDVRNIFELKNDFDCFCIQECDDKKENIAKSIGILQGKGDDDQINAICVNAAVFLLLTRKVECLAQGFENAKKAIKNNAAWNLFLKVVEGYDGERKKIYDIIK